jgi:serine protease Do
MPAGGRENSAEVLATDKLNDLAILKTSANSAIVPALRAQARVGESVFAFGFPLTGILSTSGNFTTGTVTALSGPADDSRLVQISAPVQPGNSGGPLIDKYGNVVGVIVSKLNALNIAAATHDIPQNVNFAIKSSIVLNFLNANSLTPNASTKSRELTPEALADLARLFTVRVTCNLGG